MKKLDKMWKVLQEAKKHLAWCLTDEMNPDKVIFVCHAVERAFGESKLLTRLKTDLGKFIYEELEGYYTFYDWLYDKHPELRDAIIHDEDWRDGVKMQQTRSNWMNSMIARLKATDL